MQAAPTTKDCREGRAGSVCTPCGADRQRPNNNCSLFSFSCRIFGGGFYACNVSLCYESGERNPISAVVEVAFFLYCLSSEVGSKDKAAIRVVGGAKTVKIVSVCVKYRRFIVVAVGKVLSAPVE